AHPFPATDASIRFRPDREPSAPSYPLLRVFPSHKLGPDRQLMRRQTHGRGCRGPVHTLHLEEDLAGEYHRHPLLWSALTFAHTGFGGLLGNRLVRKEPDPHLAAALDGSRHGHARGLDLPRGNPRAFERLEPKFAEGNRRTAPRLAGHAPALLLSILDLLRHH